MSGGIPSPFIQQVFPNAVKRVLSSSDSAILQVFMRYLLGVCLMVLCVKNGGECVRAFISVAVEQLAAW